VNEATFPILSLTIWLPILGGLVIIALGDESSGADQSGPLSSKGLALGVSILTFLVSLFLYFGFDRSTAAMQFIEQAAWLPAFDINYTLGIDGIALPLIVLTTLINVVVVISAWEVIKDRPAIYLGAFQIMTGLMVGVFWDIQHPGHAHTGVGTQAAVVDFHRFPARLRRQDSHVAGPHVVAGCTRRSAHRRLCRVGGNHVEDGRLWLFAL